MYAYENKSLEDMDGEVWKPISEFNGDFEVSNKGRVKGVGRWVDSSNKNGTHFKYVEPKIIAQHDGGRSRLKVVLKFGGRQYNRFVKLLIAQHFLGYTPHQGTVVKNYDGDYRNNNVENLIICARNRAIEQTEKGVRKVQLRKTIWRSKQRINKEYPARYCATPESGIYLIKNGRDVYIGESHNMHNRIVSHNSINTMGVPISECETKVLRLMVGATSIERRKVEEDFIYYYIMKGYNVLNYKGVPEKEQKYERKVCVYNKYTKERIKVYDSLDTAKYHAKVGSTILKKVCNGEKPWHKDFTYRWDEDSVDKYPLYSKAYIVEDVLEGHSTLYYTKSELYNDVFEGASIHNIEHSIVTGKLFRGRWFIRVK